MKKSILLLLTLSITISLFSQKKRTFDRWSFTPEYGYCWLDGDINQQMVSVFPTSFRDVTFGAALEYALTPVWGLSLDYFYFPMKANNLTPSPLTVDTRLHSVDFNATLNLTRWIFPETKTKFYLLGSIGVGLAQYYTNPIDPTTNLAPVDVLLNPDGTQIFRAGSVPVTFSFEYNILKHFAIGTKVHYRAYTKDNFEGVSSLNWKGVTNDYIASGTLYLRFKFGAPKRIHLRDTPWQDYEPDRGLVEAREAKNQIADANRKISGLDNRLSVAEQKVDTLGKRVTKLENKFVSYETTIQNFQVYMSNEGIDTDQDGVPDIRDKEPNTPRNNAVDFWGRTIVVSKSKNPGVYLEEIPSVYFDFDKTDLDNDALETISKVALKMQKDSTVFVEVRGYCDYVGKDNYNKRLSYKRAERVKKELIKVWKIDPRRILANGNGKLQSPPIIYRPNRRCDFYFNK